MNEIMIRNDRVLFAFLMVVGTLLSGTISVGLMLILMAIAGTWVALRWF